jgi:hypothetical protein
MPAVVVEGDVPAVPRSGGVEESAEEFARAAAEAPGESMGEVDLVEVAGVDEFEGAFDGMGVAAVCAGVGLRGLEVEGRRGGGAGVGERAGQFGGARSEAPPSVFESVVEERGVAALEDEEGPAPVASCVGRKESVGGVVSESERGFEGEGEVVGEEGDPSADEGGGGRGARGRGCEGLLEELQGVRGVVGDEGVCGDGEDDPTGMGAWVRGGPEGGEGELMRPGAERVFGREGAGGEDVRVEVHGVVFGCRRS